MTQQAPTFPPVYTMHLDLGGALVEGYAQDDLLIIDAQEEPGYGDLACVHHKKFGAVIMRLDAALPPHVFANMPWRESPESTSQAAVVGTILGGTKRIGLKCADLWGIHKCSGKANPADCVEATI